MPDGGGHVRALSSPVEDPHDVETLFRRVYSAGFTQRPDVSMMGVFSGIEIAIWDILGKAAGQPVCKLIGGRFHDRIRTYTYLYPRSVAPGGTPAKTRWTFHHGDAAAERALEYVEMGFTAMKQDAAAASSREDGSFRRTSSRAASTTYGAGRAPHR